ncbi:tail lysozyme [Microcystis phage Mel-JY01]
MSKYRKKNRVPYSEPELDTRFQKPLGITIPFNNPNGIFYQSYTHKTMVLTNLKLLLFTSKGERIMQPDFGTDLKFILFENITSSEDFERKISEEITSAIDEWMPYVSIQNIEVEINSDDNGYVKEPDKTVVVKLNISILGTGIFMPIQIFISDLAQLRIEEAVYNNE